MTTDERILGLVDALLEAREQIERLARIIATEREDARVRDTTAIDDGSKAS